jgi:hypothetical protein
LISLLICVQAGRTTRAPQVDARLEIKLIHSDDQFTWYNATVKAEKKDIIDKMPFTLYKVI